MKTALQKYLWMYQVQKAKMQRQIFDYQTIYINQQPFKCSVVKLHKIGDYRALNDLVKIGETNMVVYFQHLKHVLKLQFTFNLIEISFENQITRVWKNIQKITPEILKKQHLYLLISISLFKVWKLKIGDVIYID